ncbi:hypothetical protein [Kitasatospora sp. NPDC101183]|uniref:hypothetical protein n=1 Tax=Kitasatospora sp. NPDC101183 TaxID=3364100 RepID=UPI0038035BC8
MNAHRPIRPGDPAFERLSRAEIFQLIVELRSASREFGLLWPSAKPGERTLNGRVLVNLGNVPVSTVVNLLAVLREF